MNLSFASFHRFEAVALNPQPLPPRDLLSSLGASRFDIAALNPQPLPPGGLSSLNPQPLPPGGLSSLNPQPLPPGGDPSSPFQRLGMLLDDFCGTVPRKLPDFPPPPIPWW